MLKCYYQNIVIVVCVLLIKVFFKVLIFSLSDLFGELIYEPWGEEQRQGTIWNRCVINPFQNHDAGGDSSGMLLFITASSDEF